MFPSFKFGSCADEVLLEEDPQRNFSIMIVILDVAWVTNSLAIAKKIDPSMSARGLLIIAVIFFILAIINQLGYVFYSDYEYNNSIGCVENDPFTRRLVEILFGTGLILFTLIVLMNKV